MARTRGIRSALGQETRYLYATVGILSDPSGEEKCGKKLFVALYDEAGDLLDFKCLPGMGFVAFSDGERSTNVYFYSLSVRADDSVFLTGSLLEARDMDLLGRPFDDVRWITVVEKKGAYSVERPSEINFGKVSFITVSREIADLMESAPDAIRLAVYVNDTGYDASERVIDMEILSRIRALTLQDVADLRGTLSNEE